MTAGLTDRLCETRVHHEEGQNGFCFNSFSHLTLFEQYAIGN